MCDLTILSTSSDLHHEDRRCEELAILNLFLLTIHEPFIPTIHDPFPHDPHVASNSLIASLVIFFEPAFP